MNAFLRTTLFLAVATAGARSDDKITYPSGMFAELPHERGTLHSGFSGVDFPVTTADEMSRKFFQQGLAELYAGTSTEALRAFREVITRDPDCAMGYWGIAVATKDDPRRSLEFMWYAFEKRGRASLLEQQIIAAYAAHLGANKQPEMVLVDSETGKRRAKTEGLQQTSIGEFRTALGHITRQHNNVVEAQALFARESKLRSPAANAFLAAGHRHPLRPRLSSSSRDVNFTMSEAMQQRQLSAAWYSAAVSFSRSAKLTDATIAIEARTRLDNAWLQLHAAMPYEREGFFMNRNLLAMMPMNPDARDAILKIFDRAPRHPARAKRTPASFQRRIQDDQPQATITSGQQRIIESLGPLTWQPPQAPEFSLPRGKGDGLLGTKQLAGPTLVVFYLGFGCIHCVEQLNELRPRYNDFKKAGIEVVAIGTDDIDQVKAAILDSVEVDGPDTPFEILCDPEGDVFKQFHCWDEFTDEALHGTFLIDAKGNIRWRDISEEPFMKTDFLLEECTRLIKQASN